MKYKNYYEVLGLPRSATQDDIKRTYRKLARQYLPDLSKLDDAEPRFKEVGEGDGPHFDGVSLRRARKARHLAPDLEINAAGIAFALDLLDEIAVLRAQYLRR